jgi:hypothetical protein
MAIVPVERPQARKNRFLEEPMYPDSTLHCRTYLPTFQSRE